MKQRTLGQGLTVSAIGMGCLTLLEMNYGPVNDQESEVTLLEAVDRGVTFLDTGEVYGRDSANEKLIGRVLQHRRDEVVLGTKFGLVYDYRQGPMVPDSRPEAIRAACEGSLSRLRTDRIDLYYQHRTDPKVPIEDVWGELSLLVQEGKVRYVGMSEPGIETLRRAHAIHPVTAVESEYSLFTREPEDDLMRVLEELGIGLVPFAPLGRGMLSGKIRTPDDFAPDDFRRGSPDTRATRSTRTSSWWTRLRRSRLTAVRLRHSSPSRGSSPAEATSCLSRVWRPARSCGRTSRRSISI